MLLHAFLSGLGIALTYTLITIVIVNSPYVHKLPILYLVTSVLLLTKGYFYAHLEHSHQPQKLFKWVLIALFLWSFLMFLNLSIWLDSFLIIALAYCSYYVVYYLSNLEYWGTASLLFDVRQGKRLFSLLSSGESVAKILGYAMTPLIIFKLNTASVYMVVALCFAGAYLIFSRLVKRYKPSMVVNHSHGSDHNSDSSPVLTILTIKEIFGLDNFRRFISLFAFLSTLTYFVIQYAFLVRVNTVFSTQEEIAVFFAALLSIAKILNLLIKVFFSSRLCHYLGLKVVLLILPVSLLILSAVGITGILSGHSEVKFIMWVFTVIFVVDEVFRTSLYTPAYLTLFQPLSKIKRLEGHTLTKGIMEPLGLGASGLLIYLLVAMDQFHLQVLTPIVVIFLVLWIMVGNRVFFEYLGILKNALESKILKRGTLELSKDEFEILRRDKLMSKDPVERLYALQMLGNLLAAEEKLDTIKSLLEERDAYIVKSTLKIADELNIPDVGKLIIDLMNHPDKEIQKLAIYEYGREHAMDCVPFFKSRYGQLDDELKAYVIGAALKHGGLNGSIEFGRELMSFIDSENSDYRKMACDIIADIGNRDYYHPLVKLLNDKDASVREKAIIASGMIRNASLIPHIINNRKDKRLRFVIRKSLSNFGEELVEVANELFENSGQQNKIDLIRIFDKNTNKKMSDLIFKFIEDPNFEVRREALKTLYDRSYVPDDDKVQIVNKAVSDISRTIESLIKVFYKVNDEEMKDLIYNEIFQIQMKTLFHCMSLNYTRKLFRDVIENCYSSQKTTKALALELLDNSLAPKDKHVLIPLVESIFDIKDDLQEGEGKRSDISDLFRTVLRNGNTDYSSWMTANFMRKCPAYGFAIPDNDSLFVNDIILIKQEADRIKLKTA